MFGQLYKVRRPMRANSSLLPVPTSTGWEKNVSKECVWGPGSKEIVMANSRRGVVFAAMVVNKLTWSSVIIQSRTSNSPGCPPSLSLSKIALASFRSSGEIYTSSTFFPV